MNQLIILAVKNTMPGGALSGFLGLNHFGIRKQSTERLKFTKKFWVKAQLSIIFGTF